VDEGGKDEGTSVCSTRGALGVAVTYCSTDIFDDRALTGHRIFYFPRYISNQAPGPQVQGTQRRGDGTLRVDHRFAQNDRGGGII